VYSASYDYLTDGDGRLESRDVTGVFTVELQNSDRLSVRASRNYEYLARPFGIAPGVTIPTGSYGFGDAQVGWAMGNQRRVSGSVTFSAGQFYDGRIVSAGYNGARVELSPRLSLEPGISLNRISLPAGTFTTTLVSNRATFTMTPQAFLSALLQYNSSNDTLSTNLRFRWEYQPGSEIFLVYTDERDTTFVGYPALKNRAVVAKINRLFRF
jgi:hypothetical protein